MLRGEFEASDVMVIVPLTAPATDGLNFAVKDVLAPGLKVRGSVRPLKLNPLPLAVAAEIVTFSPPELIRVTD